MGRSMFGYINEIRRQFRDVYGFTPSGGTDDEPLFDSLPDGEYPMTIDGQVDKVRIVNGSISCCNFDPAIAAPNPERSVATDAKPE